MRPSLDIQLKATIQLGNERGDEYRYPLRRRNYDLLRGETLVPRILVVLHLPKDEAGWIRISPEKLVMMGCAYWAIMAGYPETTNKETVTVPIKKQNRFDIEGLKDLMNRARTGAL